MKYYPLKIVEQMEEIHPPELLMKTLEDHDLVNGSVSKEELHDFAFGPDFFNPYYKGKFETLNNEMMFNKELNKRYIPMYSMEQVDGRRTEWKDALTTDLVIDMWKDFKMVYKIDNDFFHEIKQTENVITSKEMFDKLPFKCFFIDLTEVRDISDFRGAFVYVTKNQIEGEEYYTSNIYLTQSDKFVFFTHYSTYRFNSKHEETQWNIDDLNTSEFIARENSSTYIDISNLKDVRGEIIMAIFQMMSFIAIDASDVTENRNTKNTYKPRKAGIKPKNKFSEIRMWDVGIRYGKAIKLAKREYSKHKDRQQSEKERKPTRPHIRRAHWQRYHIGKGRKDTKTVWIAPIYVCGNGKEIPVTIREVKK